MSRLMVKGIGANVKLLPLEPRQSRKIGIIVREKNRQDKNIRNFTNCTIQALGSID
jgi:hypothetical protein